MREEVQKNTTKFDLQRDTTKFDYFFSGESIRTYAPAVQARQYAQPAPAPAPTYGGYGPTLPASYSFAWAVKDDYSGNDFGQNEAREADNTKGKYYVTLPDGRVQTVTYTVDAYSGKLRGSARLKK